MTAEQMMEMLKKNYDIADMKDFLERYNQTQGLDIGIFTTRAECKKEAV